MVNRRKSAGANIRQELTRHSSFVEDGRKLFQALIAAPGVTKVKHLGMSGRRAKTRRIKIKIEPQSTSCKVTIGCNNGHQRFRAFTTGTTAAYTLRNHLETKFPGYEVSIAV